MEIEYVRPYLYPKQHDAIFNEKRWRLIEASTKSGKTVGSIAQFLEWGFAGQSGQHFWWVAPIADQSRIAFSRVKAGLPKGSFTARETPNMTVTLINGPVLWFKSADNPDSLFGEDVYGAIIDEASRAKPEAWYAVRSTLTATRGPCIIIGNVKGRKNWFYDFCRRVEAGQEPNGNYARITWQDAVEAGVLDLEEIEDARRNMPEAVFQEIYEAVAADDAGNPFGQAHIEACVRGLSNYPPVAYGLDLAKSNDYLVLIGLDEDGNVCQFHRWNHIPWKESVRRVHEIVGEDVPCLVDSTGVGDPVLEYLQVEHGNFIGYTFSPLSKQRLMEGLAVSIQGHEIGFPDGSIKTELLSFEYVIGRTGVRYSAPEGYHDDCVCSLALAREQLSTVAPAASLIKYYDAKTRQAKEQAAQAEQEPESIGREFVRRLKLPSVEIVDRELVDLYNKTIQQYQPKAYICVECGNPVGNTRTTDGEFVWHPECAGRMAV